MIATLVAARLPDESIASATILCDPAAREVVSRGSVQLVVPCASWAALLSTCTFTVFTDTSSEAVPETVIAPDTVMPSAGETMETPGDVVSMVVIGQALRPLHVLFDVAPRAEPASASRPTVTTTKLIFRIMLL